MKFAMIFSVGLLLVASTCYASAIYPGKRFTDFIDTKYGPGHISLLRIPEPGQPPDKLEFSSGTAAEMQAAIEAESLQFSWAQVSEPDGKGFAEAVASDISLSKEARYAAINASHITDRDKRLAVWLEDSKSLSSEEKAVIETYGTKFELPLKP